MKVLLLLDSQIDSGDFIFFRILFFVSLDLISFHNQEKAIILSKYRPLMASSH
jgi:hypothetical protein